MNRAVGILFFVGLVALVQVLLPAAAAGEGCAVYYDATGRRITKKEWVRVMAEWRARRAEALKHPDQPPPKRVHTPGWIYDSPVAMWHKECPPWPPKRRRDEEINIVKDNSGTGPPDPPPPRRGKIAIRSAEPQPKARRLRVTFVRLTNDPRAGAPFTPLAREAVRLRMRYQEQDWDQTARTDLQGNAVFHLGPFLEMQEAAGALPDRLALSVSTLDPEDDFVPVTLTTEGFNPPPPPQQRLAVRSTEPQPKARKLGVRFVRIEGEPRSGAPFSPLPGEAVRLRLALAQNHWDQTARTDAQGFAVFNLAPFLDLLKAYGSLPERMPLSVSTLDPKDDFLPVAVSTDLFEPPPPPPPPPPPEYAFEPPAVSEDGVVTLRLIATSATAAGKKSPPAPAPGIAVEVLSRGPGEPVSREHTTDEQGAVRVDLGALAERCLLAPDWNGKADLVFSARPAGKKLRERLDVPREGLEKIFADRYARYLWFAIEKPSATSPYLAARLIYAPKGAGGSSRPMRGVALQWTYRILNESRQQRRKTDAQGRARLSLCGVADMVTYDRDPDKELTFTVAAPAPFRCETRAKVSSSDLVKLHGKWRERGGLCPAAETD